MNYSALSVHVHESPQTKGRRKKERVEGEKFCGYVLGQPGPGVSRLFPHRRPALRNHVKNLRVRRQHRTILRRSHEGRIEESNLSHPTTIKMGWNQAPGFAGNGTWQEICPATLNTARTFRRNVPNKKSTDGKDWEGRAAARCTCGWSCPPENENIQRSGERTEGEEGRTTRVEGRLTELSRLGKVNLHKNGGKLTHLGKRGQRFNSFDRVGMRGQRSQPFKEQTFRAIGTLRSNWSLIFPPS